MDSEPQRLRQHPADRFAGPQHAFNLNTVATRLRQENHPVGSTHRQESLYKHGPTSISLFLFAPQAKLASHRARGTVFIQVLNGHLRVTAEGQPNDLGPGGLLVLAAGVEHDLLALENTEMLLTVNLDPKPTAPL